MTAQSFAGSTALTRSPTVAARWESPSFSDGSLSWAAKIGPSLYRVRRCYLLEVFSYRQTAREGQGEQRALEDEGQQLGYALVRGWGPHTGVCCWTSHVALEGCVAAERESAPIRHEDEDVLRKVGWCVELVRLLQGVRSSPSKEWAPLGLREEDSPLMADGLLRRENAHVLTKVEPYLEQAHSP